MEWLPKFVDLTGSKPNLTGSSLDLTGLSFPSMVANFVIRNSQSVWTLFVPLQCKSQAHKKKTQQHILPLNNQIK